MVNYNSFNIVPFTYPAYHLKHKHQTSAPGESWTGPPLLHEPNRAPRNVAHIETDVPWSAFSNLVENLA